MFHCQPCGGRIVLLLMVLLLSSWWIGVDRFGDLIRVEFLLWKGLHIAWAMCLEWQGQKPPETPWIDSFWLSVMQQLWGVFFNYISNIEKFSVVEDHLAYILIMRWDWVRVVFLFSLRCCHRRVVIFQNPPGLGWWSSHLSLMEPWVRPRFRVGREADVGGLVGGKTTAANWEGLERVERNREEKWRMIKVWRILFFYRHVINNLIALWCECVK